MTATLAIRTSRGRPCAVRASPCESAERLLQPPLGATLSPEVCGEGELRPAQRRSSRSQAARRPGGVYEGEGTGAFPVAVVTVSPGR